MFTVTGKFFWCLKKGRKQNSKLIIYYDFKTTVNILLSLYFFFALLIFKEDFEKNTIYERIHTLP